MRRGKKPTCKQKIRLGQVGLSPDNWLVVRQDKDGKMIVLHKNTNHVRTVKAPNEVNYIIGITIGCAYRNLNIFYADIRIYRCSITNYYGNEKRIRFSRNVF